MKSMMRRVRRIVRVAARRAVIAAASHRVSRRVSHRARGHQRIVKSFSLKIIEHFIIKKLQSFFE
jgi:hypothetical protein